MAQNGTKAKIIAIGNEKTRWFVHLELARNG
jgi:hypothetical protein